MITQANKKITIELSFEDELTVPMIEHYIRELKAIGKDTEAMQAGFIGCDVIDFLYELRKLVIT